MEVGGEAVDDLGSPCGFLLASEDDFPGVPVGVDDDWVGGKDGTDAGVAEVGLDLLQGGSVGLGQGRGGRGYGKDGPVSGAATGEAWFHFLGWFAGFRGHTVR